MGPIPGSRKTSTSLPRERPAPEPALATRHPRLHGVSLGRTVSDLVRRGLNASTPARDKDGLVVFHLPPDSPKVTTEDVRRIEAEGA